MLKDSGQWEEFRKSKLEILYIKIKEELENKFDEQPGQRHLKSIT